MLKKLLLVTALIFAANTAIADEVGHEPDSTSGQLASSSTTTTSGAEMEASWLDAVLEWFKLGDDEGGEG